MTRDWVVESASVAALRWMAPSVGRCLWDVWPASEPIFRPIYEQAWDTGRGEGIGFFMGVLVELNVTQIGDKLDVAYVELGHLDVTSCESLADSLIHLRRLCRERQPQDLPPLPAPLRVVPRAS